MKRENLGFLKLVALCTLLVLVSFSFVQGQNLQISGGNNFSAALCTNGRIYAWGNNSAGQLGRDATNVKYPEAFLLRHAWFIFRPAICSQ